VSNTPSEPPIRVFLSYAQADDLVLEFIVPFTAALKHLTNADHGRDLDIFIDRESVGWGEDWRTAIRSSIDSAMVFMPIITRQYFNRPACREELLTFHSEARALGVTSLLLPVVLLGHSYISADSQDIAARLISERQCRDLKEAWIAGAQSPIWRATIVQLAGELVEAATAAERALTDGIAPPTTGPSQDADDDAPGAAEVSEALEHFGEESQRLVTSLADVLNNVPGAMSNPERLLEMSQADARRELLDVASQLQPLGAEFQDRGREFESVAVRTDEIMRAYVRYLRESGNDEFLERERASLDGTEEALEPVADAERYLAEFIEQLRPLEVTSAPMRNSLRGFREGGKAIRGGIAIMRSWPRIVDES
jgi:hypothetical protein